MWSEHGGTVDDSARVQVSLDLEIFVRVYTATIHVTTKHCYCKYQSMLHMNNSSLVLPLLANHD